MGATELREKLGIALKEELKKESQVIYILSRIRKVMEIDRTKSKYKILNVFCNWALHTKIDRAEDMKNIWEEFIFKKESRTYDLIFKDFVRDFIQFLKDNYNIKPTLDYMNNFIRLLTETISDTPIAIYKVKKISITINPASLEKVGDGITYKIEASEI